MIHFYKWISLYNHHLDENIEKIKPVNPKGNHWKDWCWSWSSNTWPLDANSQLTGKDPEAGKDWRQKKRVAEDEVVGWDHQLNGHALGQTLGDSEEQGGLACCSPWGCKESDMTYSPNNSNPLIRRFSQVHPQSKTNIPNVQVLLVFYLHIDIIPYYIFSWVWHILLNINFVGFIHIIVVATLHLLYCYRLLHFMNKLQLIHYSTVNEFLWWNHYE